MCKLFLATILVLTLLSGTLSITAKDGDTVGVYNCGWVVDRYCVTINGEKTGFSLTKSSGSTEYHIMTGAVLPEIFGVVRVTSDGRYKFTPLLGDDGGPEAYAEFTNTFGDVTNTLDQSQSGAYHAFGGTIIGFANAIRTQGNDADLTNIRQTVAPVQQPAPQPVPAPSGPSPSDITQSPSSTGGGTVTPASQELDTIGALLDRGDSQLTTAELDSARQQLQALLDDSTTPQDLRFRVIELQTASDTIIPSDVTPEAMVVIQAHRQPLASAGQPAAPDGGTLDAVPVSGAVSTQSVSQSTTPAMLAGVRTTFQNSNEYDDLSANEALTLLNTLNAIPLTDLSSEDRTFIQRSKARLMSIRNAKTPGGLVPAGGTQQTPPSAQVQQTPSPPAPPQPQPSQTSSSTPSTLSIAAGGAITVKAGDGSQISSAAYSFSPTDVSKGTYALTVDGAVIANIKRNPDGSLTVTDRNTIDNTKLQDLLTSLGATTGAAPGQIPPNSLVGNRFESIPQWRLLMMTARDSLSNPQTPRESSMSIVRSTPSSRVQSFLGKHSRDPLFSLASQGYGVDITGNSFTLSDGSKITPDREGYVRQRGDTLDVYIGSSTAPSVAPTARVSAQGLQGVDPKTLPTMLRGVQQAGVIPASLFTDAGSLKEPAQGVTVSSGSITVDVQKLKGSDNSFWGRVIGRSSPTQTLTADASGAITNTLKTSSGVELSSETRDRDTGLLLSSTTTSGSTPVFTATKNTDGTFTGTAVVGQDAQGNDITVTTPLFPVEVVRGNGDVDTLLIAQLQDKDDNPVETSAGDPVLVGSGGSLFVLKDVSDDPADPDNTDNTRKPVPLGNTWATDDNDKERDELMEQLRTTAGMTDDEIDTAISNGEEVSFRSTGGKKFWDAVGDEWGSTSWTEFAGSFLGHTNPAFDGYDEAITGYYHPEKWADRKKEVTKKFCEQNGIGTIQDCYISKLCEIVPRHSSGGALTVGSGGSRRNVVSLQASRSPPLMSDTGRGAVYFYTIEYYMNNPTSEDLTIQLRLSGGGVSDYSNGRFYVLSNGSSAVVIGGSAIVRELMEKYDTICLSFNPSIKDSKGKEHSGVCSPIVESVSSAGSPIIPEPSPSTQQPAGPVNSSRAQRPQELV